MRRRAFIAGLGSAVAWPIAGRAQQSTKPVIGFLGSTSPEGAAAPIEAVRQSLKDAGVDPGNVQFDYQFAQGHYDRLPVLASELVRKNVAVIIASGSANAAVAAKTATRSIPVVFLNGSDPVVFGLVPNINRPEGNITGVTTFTNAMGAKRLGILRELVPNAAHVSMLINPSSAIIAPEVEETRAAAVATGVQLEIIAASTEGDLATAFDLLAKSRPEALIVGSDPFFAAHTRQITGLATRNALPAMYQWREFVQAGGLISYGTRLLDGYHE